MTPGARSAWARRPCCAGALRDAAARVRCERKTRRRQGCQLATRSCDAPLICATSSRRAGAAAGSSGCQETAAGVSVSVPAAALAPAGTVARVACSVSASIAVSPAARRRSARRRTRRGAARRVGAWEAPPKKEARPQRSRPYARRRGFAVMAAVASSNARRALQRLAPRVARGATEAPAAPVTGRRFGALAGAVQRAAHRRAPCAAAGRSRPAAPPRQCADAAAGRLFGPFRASDGNAAAERRSALPRARLLDRGYAAAATRACPCGARQPALTPRKARWRAQP